MEIIDVELYVVYRALEHLKQQRLEEKQVVRDLLAGRQG
jgi:hypothetical protein